MEAVGDDDPIECDVCKGQPSVGNPVIKCDGEHEFETGFHLNCLPKVLGPDGQLVRPPLPPDDEDWLCPQCVSKGLFIIKEITNKRVSRGKTQYAVIYASGGSNHEEEWCNYSDLCTNPHAKSLISKYNASHRGSKNA